MADPTITDVRTTSVAADQGGPSTGPSRRRSDEHPPAGTPTTPTPETGFRHSNNAAPVEPFASWQEQAAAYEAMQAKAQR